MFLAALVIACGSSAPSGAPTATPSEPTATQAAAAITPRPVNPTPTPAASCPAYEPSQPDAGAISETRSTNGLQSPAAAESQRFVLQGVLLSRTCDVRANTGLDVWHTDARAHYGPPTNDGSLRCCYYAATVTTDANGRFEVHTIRPATSPDPGGELPAHVHLALVGATGANVDTSLNFADDPAYDGPPGPQNLTIEMERRTDADGEYWFAFVVVPI